LLRAGVAGDTAGDAVDVDEAVGVAVEATEVAEAGAEVDAVAGGEAAGGG